MSIAFLNVLTIAAVALVLNSPVSAQYAPTSPDSVSLNSLGGMEVLNGRAEMANHRGRRAVHLISSPENRASDDAVIAILNGSDFRDGIIEVEVAGAPRPDAPADSRGFIGIAFHVEPHGSRLENIYLRPTNGRADDQLRRNHSVQYTSEPDFPWYRLRKESPGVYESYVDLEPSAWTKMKIVVSGETAQLFVNGGIQPCLIVKDLKMGHTFGKIALWAHWTTDAYFSNLHIEPERLPK